MKLGTIFGSFLIVLCLLSATHAADIAIIAGDDFPKGSLTSAEVKDIFLGNMEMIEGTKVFPLDQKDSEEIKKEFMKRIIEMSVIWYNRHWTKRVFREGGTPPAVKGTQDEVIRGVKEKKGTVGYIWKDEAKGKDGIKILLTLSGS